MKAQIEYKEVEHAREVCILRIAHYSIEMIKEPDKTIRILLSTMLRRE